MCLDCPISTFHPSQFPLASAWSRPSSSCAHAHTHMHTHDNTKPRVLSQEVFSKTLKTHNSLPAQCSHLECMFFKAAALHRTPHLCALDQRHLALPVNLVSRLLRPCSCAVNHSTHSHHGGRESGGVGQVCLQVGVGKYLVNSACAPSQRVAPNAGQVPMQA